MAWLANRLTDEKNKRTQALIKIIQLRYSFILNPANISTQKLDAIILQSLFAILNSNKVKYCIVNNYENLPEFIPSDVDIAIEPTSFKNIDTFIAEIAKKHDVKIVQKIWHGYQKCAYILSPSCIDTRFRLQLDFFTDFSARGYPYLITHEQLLNDRRPFKSFFIPSPDVEALMLFMRRVIKNDIKTPHIMRMKSLYEMNPDDIEKTMIDCLGQKAWKQITDLMTTGDVQIFNKNIKSYRRTLKFRSLKTATFLYLLKYIGSQILRAFNRLLYPVGICVVFLGPDGSGKSTIAKLVLERVSGSFHGSKIMYWRPNLLPMMGHLKLWAPTDDIVVNPDPHGHPKQGMLKSYVRFFYYLTDYILGYVLKVYWPKVRKQIIIFDRYYYDYLVDLHRYRFNVPRWLPRFFLPLVPTPDIIVYLDADPDVLEARKQELPKKELIRQVGEYRKLISALPKSHKINSNVPIETIVKRISTIVLETKARQTAKTIGSHLKYGHPSTYEEK